MKKIIFALLICVAFATAAVAECPCQKKAAVKAPACPCEMTNGVCNCS